MCKSINSQNKICDACFSLNEVFSLPCFHKLCKNCLEKGKNDCLLCNSLCWYCKNTGKVLVIECGHNFCNRCYGGIRDYQYSCVFCSNEYNEFTCENCNKVSFDIIKLKCGHVYCKNCNQADECPKCPKETCSGCLKTDFLFEKDCQHKLCGNCFSIEPCILCRPKLLCNGCKSFYQDQTSFCSHQYCEKCIKNKSCEDCNNPKCNICFKKKNTYIYECGHQICELCNNTEYCSICNKCMACDSSSNVYKQKCDHFLCKKCQSASFCRICFPSYFCKTCSFYSSKDIAFCKHGICITCRKVSKCDQCICEVCHNISELKLNSCGHSTCYRCRIELLCKNCFEKECSICGKRNQSKILNSCGHFGCLHHFNKNKCPTCNPEVFCKKCLMLKNEQFCIHGNCLFCRKMYKVCECVCEICKIDKKFILNQCGHVSCEACKIGENCKNCYEHPCDICNKKKTGKKVKQCYHRLCINCFKEDSCSACDKYDLCKKCCLYKPSKLFDRNEFCYECQNSQVKISIDKKVVDSSENEFALMDENMKNLPIAKNICSTSSKACKYCNSTFEPKIVDNISECQICYKKECVRCDYPISSTLMPRLNHICFNH